MRLRRAILEIPPKSSVPPELPVYEVRSARAHSESALPQVLMPLQFNSPRISVYRKPVRGSPRKSPKVFKLIATRTSPCRSHRITRNSIPIIHFRALSVTHGVHPSSQTLFRFRFDRFAAAAPICYFPSLHTLTRSFAPRQTLSSIFSVLSAPFPENTRVGASLGGATLFCALALSNCRFLPGTFPSLVTSSLRCFLLVLPSPPQPGAVHA